jgi:CheY-like chemotaxis protein
MTERTEGIGRRVLVLLADDDEEDRILVHEAWEASGVPAELQSVAGGRELLDYLLRGPVALPDLILLDLDMPGMDGRAVLAELGARDELRRIPVVMFSARPEGPQVSQCYALGARSYVSKPQSFGGLVDVLRGLSEYWFETVRLPSVAGGFPSGTE